MHKTFLIVGGTSGLGLSLAIKYRDSGHIIHITGRHNPEISGLIYHDFDITENSTTNLQKIEKLIMEISGVNTLIYSAGFSQEGIIDEIEDKDIQKMIELGITVPALLIKKLKNNPFSPLKVILITSSSQYTARKKESIYCSVKSGLGMLGRCLAYDEGLGKICVFAPSGMKTPFWEAGKNTDGYLDPEWVADMIIEYSAGIFKYKYIQIVRDPKEVKIVEEIKNES